MRMKPALIGLCTAFLLCDTTLAAEPVLDIGTRRQSFFRSDVIGSLQRVKQVLHHLQRREIVLKPEHPWETFGVS